jgi:flagellar hook-associated protein 1 FlgK
MSLSTALNIAQNSLLNSQRQTTVVSKNIANAYNENYSRRTSIVSSLAPGNRIAEVRRATDEALFRQNLNALSGWTAQSTIVNGLDRLNLAVNGVDNATSPATLLGKMQEAIQLYSSTPSNRTLGENAIEAARSLVRSLNDGTSQIQKFRAEMDSQIALGVAELNALLAQFQKVNDEIKLATTSGREALDAYDQRDELLSRIAELVPISTITRANNDMMIVTADGMTLFESTPRSIQFTATPIFASDTVGSQILVDGVPLSPGNGANTNAGGTLAAMLQLRDVYAGGLQAQLDEVARGLILAFSEEDPNTPGSFSAGLFVSVDPSVDLTTADRKTGLAGKIAINPDVDPIKLRDGINYDINPGLPADRYANFTGLLNKFSTAMDAHQTFVGADGSSYEMSLMNYSTGAISWLEDARKNADYGAETKSALLVRTAEALSNVTNVNVDEEMALMLELEQSYAASAKLLQMIDEMLETLLSVVR